MRQGNNVLGAYQQLRNSHPAFPEVLRDFQVIKSTTNSTACTLLPLQADIVAAAINAEDGHHILSSLPTGMGKTLPMIVASCFLPPGVLSFFSMKRSESCLSLPHRNLLSLLQIIFQGSTTMIIVPLTTIMQQLEEDCTRLGISFLVGDQVNSRLDSDPLSQHTLAVRLC